MATEHRFSFPTDIRFGPGVRAGLVEHLRSSGLSRPLVVTDAGVAALGSFTDLVANLAAGGHDPEIFDGVRGNPVELAGRRRCGRLSPPTTPTAVVGIGGGAALDVAKAVALLATHPGVAVRLRGRVARRPGDRSGAAPGGAAHHGRHR